MYFHCLILNPNYNNIKIIITKKYMQKELYPKKLILIINKLKSRLF